MLASRVPWGALLRRGARPGRRWLSQDVLAELESIFGPKGVSSTDAIREQHSRDEGPHAPAAPDVVVFAQDTSQVSRSWRHWAFHGQRICE